MSFEDRRSEPTLRHRQLLERSNEELPGNGVVFLSFYPLNTSRVADIQAQFKIRRESVES